MTQENILIIDNDEEILKIYSKVLSKAGYKVSIAETGLEGFNKVLNERPKMILLDMMLPDTNGLEILKKIKSDPELKEIYIIIISDSVTLSEIQSKGLEAGADGYLVKQIENKQLVARADAAFRHITTLEILKKSENELNQLNKKIEQQNDELKKNNAYLMNSHTASLNLLSDLKTEIEERKQAEKAVVESEKRFRDLISTVRLLAVTLDLDGNITFCNDYLLDLTGWKYDEVIRKNWFKYFLPENVVELVLEVFKKAIGSVEFPAHFENEILTRNGERRIIEWNNTILRDANGKIVGSASIGADITERKRAEILLNKNEARLRTLLQSIPDLVWLKDVNGVFLSCNQMFERLMDAKTENIIGKTDFDFFAPDLAEFFQQNDLKAIKAGNPTKNEEWVTFLDNGQNVLLETIKSPVYDQDKNLIGVLGIGRDITSRHIAAKQLKESEEKFRNLVESINEVYYTSDKNGKIIYISPNLELLTGFTVQEVLGKSYLKFIEPVDQRKVINHYLEQSKKGAQDTTIEFRVRTKDGGSLWAGQLSHIVYDEKGNVIEYRNVARDITDRKVVEEELRLSREQFRAYFDSSSVGLSVTAPDKTWIEVNQKLCDMMGYSKEELTNVTWVALTHPDDLAANLELFDQAAEGKIDSYSLDKRFIRKDGKIIYATISTTVQRNQDGSINHLLTSYTDITQRKQAEILLKEAEERYRTIFEQSPYGVVIIDPETTLPIEFNEVAHLQLGYTKNEFANKRINDYEVIEYQQETKKYIQRVLREGQIEFISLHKTKGGELRDIYISIQTIKLKGRLTLYSIYRDITEGRRADAKLKENELKFRSVWEKSTDGMRITDQAGIVLLANNAYCNLVNKSQSEVEMKPMASVYNRTRFDEIIKKHRERFLSESIPEHLETSVTLWNGNKLFLELSNAFLNIPNQPKLLLTVFRDITERKIAESNLLESENKLRALTARLEKIKEEERISLSRELHDHLGQNLTGLKMEIAFFAKKIKTERFSNPDDLLEKSNSMLSLIDEMINNVRKISAELRPNVLDYLGLIPAIEWQIGELMKRTDLKIELISRPIKIDLGVLKNSSIFRIVQEAFTNIVRHANATKVVVSILEEKDSFRLEILDNGVGFKEKDISDIKSLGITGMRERTLQFNGKLTLENAPQGGTLLSLIIPKAEN